ncbi:MAG: hypothetical protein ACXAC7_00565 [Candidatus Hodarchaeales archaeon]|jgi:Fe2+ or Zn2+ uptake regulation protein
MTKSDIMPKQTLTMFKLLEILQNLKNSWDQGNILTIDPENISKELEKANIDASKRTIYRRLSELRQEGLISQTVAYYRKYRLTSVESLPNSIIVDKNDKRLRLSDLEVSKSFNILKEEGEIKTQQFVITEKGKNELKRKK